MEDKTKAAISDRHNGDEERNNCTANIQNSGETTKQENENFSCQEQETHVSEGTLKDRKGFTFYDSYEEAFSCLENDGDKLAFLTAIVRYGLHREDTHFDKPILKVSWALAKPSLESGWVKAEKGHLGKGTSRNVGNSNASKQYRNNTETIQYNKVKDKVKIKIKDKRESNENALSLSQEVFKKECMSFVDKHPYTKELVVEFYRYYSMTTPDGRILKETLPAWDTETMLRKWYKNEWNKNH